MLFAAVLCIGVLPAVAFAAESQESVWDGTSVATAYESGDGTEESPYEIATADQFAYFAQQIDQGIGGESHYVLSSDLDMSAASWNPICGLLDDYDAGKYFHGYFDGDGHCITYQISDHGEVGPYAALGLFGFAEGEISDLSVDGSISGIPRFEASWTGGLCGLFAGTITGCSSAVDLSISDGESSASMYGGLTGEMQGGTMEECRYSGSIDLSFSKANYDLCVGGLSGTVYAGTIEASKNQGSVSVAAQKDFAADVGGVVGMVYTGGSPVTSSVLSCYNEGPVSSTSDASGVASAVSAILVGDAGGSSVARVENCFSRATVTGSRSAAAIASEVYSKDNTGSGDSAVSATVENCYYLEGSDEHGQKAGSEDELYALLAKTSEPGTWVLDAGGKTRLYWEVKTQPAPEASFNATGEDSGVLSNVDSSMRYSVDGGATWRAVEGSSVKLEGVSAENDVRVYRPGNGTDVLDSDVQTIDVMQAARPEASGVDCTTAAQDDGSIAGVDATMEYRAASDSDWADVEGDEVTGLAPGTYYVRVKANGTALASPYQEIAIGEHVCTPDGEGWRFDEAGHWQTCDCGTKLDPAPHEFSWVVDREATATESGSKHEECTICGYAKDPVEIPATGVAGSGGTAGEDGTQGGGADGEDVTSSDAIPQTGDAVGIGALLLGAVALGSAAALVIAFVRIRRGARIR